MRRIKYWIAMYKWWRECPSYFKNHSLYGKETANLVDQRWWKRMPKL